MRLVVPLNQSNPAALAKPLEKSRPPEGVRRASSSSRARRIFRMGLRRIGSRSLRNEKRFHMKNHPWQTELAPIAANLRGGGIMEIHMARGTGMRAKGIGLALEESRLKGEDAARPRMMGT